MTQPAQETVEEKAAVWEDFVDILHEPAEVFRRRQSNGYWIPLAVYAVMISFLSFANARILRPVHELDLRREMRKLTEQNPGMDLGAGQGMMESFETLLTLSSGIFAAVIVILTGSILYIGGKLAGSRQSVRSGIVVAAYAGVVTIVEGIAVIVEGYVRGPSRLTGMSQLSWSPARFLDPDTSPPLVFFLAGRLDVFMVWWLALLAIGLATTGKIPRTQAVAVVVTIWALISLPGFVRALMA